MLFLVIIYVIFIGLGIPDSLFGAAWPAIYQEFALPVSWASFVTLTISGGTIVSSLMASRLIGRFGTGRVTAVSTALTALALLGFSCSKSFWFLWFMAIPLGLGAGAIDTGLNNYVALHYKATHMNFLHCFYGVGVSLSPFFMSLALSDSANWRGGYRTVFWFQLAIAVLAVLSLPLWKKAEPERPAEEQAATGGKASLLKNPKIYLTGTILFASCSMEYICGNWGSTFLVGAKGMAVDAAASVITFYYIGMTLSRFLSGVLSSRLSSWQLIKGAQGFLVLAMVLLLLPLPSWAACAALFFIGLGNGTMFPNMLHLTPVNFGAEQSQFAMGLQMAIAYLGILAMPALFGWLAQHISVGIFPCFQSVLYVAMLAGILLLGKINKKGT